ncbi:MAG: VWA domain-containing protein [Polyangiaceae bacterium]|nr:VWA domain-containing protein [Polyangiaceae bacterium]
MLRVIDELCWTLRRAGFAISPERSALAARAVALVGLDDRSAVEDALATVLAESAADAERLRRLVRAYFDPRAAHRLDVTARLVAGGLDAALVADVVAIARSLAEGGDPAAAALLALLDGRTLSHRLLSREVEAALGGASNPATRGYFVERVSEVVGLRQARGGAARLRIALVAALGEELGGRAALLLERELADARTELQRHVVARMARLAPVASPSLSHKPLTQLDEAEAEEVRRAVRALAARLSGSARVRARHARRGRLDARRTLRAATRTLGAPLRLARRDRRRERPRLVVLADVSASVRPAAAFLLELTLALHALFERTRSFVFVSEVAETTALFAAQGPRAVAGILSGEVVPLDHESSYGRALAAFDARAGAELDRRTTVVIVGDGRTNYADPRVDLVAKLRERAGHVLWICPEPRGLWGAGDSAMPLYGRAVHRVLQASTAAELELAARAMARRR